MERLYPFMSVSFIMFSIFIIPLTAQTFSTKKKSQTVLKVGDIISKTKIDRVTVFSDRSLVERTGTISIPAGESRVKIEFLPQQIDPKSVRISAMSNSPVILGGLEVFHQHWTPEIIQALKDSIQTIRDKIDELTTQENSLAIRKDFVKSVASFGSFQQKSQKIILNPQNLVQTASFIEDQLKKIAGDGISISREKRKLNKKLKILQEKLSNITGNNTAGKGYSIEVPIESESAGSLSVRLSYVIYNSSWSPAYDARYDDATGKVHLTYFGSITQSTSEDWNDAKIILSTTQPQLGTQPPKLSIWYLQKYEPLNYSKEERFLPEESMSFAEGMESNAPAPIPAKYSTAKSMISLENVVFEVSGRKDIPSDGQIHKVVIAELTLDADKKFISVPKLNPKIYLTAKCKNSSDYLLLPGEISIFQGDEYIGTQYLQKTVAFNGKITIAMGAVQTIKIERKRVKEFAENTGIIGQNRRQFFAFDITVTNNSKHHATIEVIDQIPVSADEKIEVANVKFEPTPDIRDRDFEGQIIWKVGVDAGEKKSLKYQFAVKYPKDMNIQGL